MNKHIETKQAQWAKLNAKNYMTLVKLLDKEVSWYVRYHNQFPPDSGYCKCYTCGAILPVKQIQCGHFISRRYFATRFDLDNLRPQCSGCNKWRNGEAGKFRFNLVQDVGEERVKKLEVMALSGGQKYLPREWIIEQILEYREKNKGTRT